ncbi:MAG TPA: class I adenylate-forming enzyme family protein [Acidimicrobiales bacterium]|nr:class I adenylate-forming enzyme family protein [Acidimicrobiales bacterium]
MATEGLDLGFRPTIGEALRRAAERFGERDFLVMPDRRISFGEAEAASANLARRLLAAGIGKGTRVGLFFTYGPEWLVSWLAVSRIGALCMPFSTTYRPAELGKVLRLGDVDTLLLPHRLLGRDLEPFLVDTVPGLASSDGPPHFLAELPYLRSVWMSGGHPPGWARPLDFDPTPLDPVDDALLRAVEDEVVPADWAVVVYTSGSSAEPKGVVHTHGTVLRDTAGLAQMMEAQAAQTGHPPRLFCAFPFFWVGGILCLGAALQAGHTLLCLERFEPGPALELIERERGTATLGWPTLISALRDHPSFAERDLGSAPSLTSGPADMALLETPVPGIPGHRGMSETMGQHQLVEERVRDVDTGEDLPEMAEGELVIRGPGLMAAYYKQEREEVFGADGWFHTGDRVFQHEGRAYFVGRYTEIIKSRGANVSPREVELALETFPEILHAFVVGLPHAEHGEEVVAVLVAADGAEIDPEAVRRQAREDLSSFKVPTRIEVWPVEEIPWLPSHKPDKLKIRAALEQ